MTTKTIEAYARQEDLLRDEIAEVNGLLGLRPGARHKITFGYIGNCDANGARDYREWFVFLPHPNRVGQSDDRLGGFPTGDLDGIVAVRRSLKALAQGIKLARTMGRVQ